jgi:hypothetical protein
VTREEAERERDRKAEEVPKDTWIVSEQEPGDWRVYRLDLKPSAVRRTETVESRPRPPQADDPRTAHDQNVGPFVGPV